MSVSPIIARQIPIRAGEQICGFVDLALERAFNYRPGRESEEIDIPDDLQPRGEARTHMLEQCADHDDDRLEQLLIDDAPGAKILAGSRP